jgi:serine/threonine protein kinase
MGGSQSEDATTTPYSSINRGYFSFEYIIGKGGFGRVWRVRMKKTKEILAIKEMIKTRVVAKYSVSSVLDERRLLAVIKHPFIVNMQFAFQDRNNLYLAMDLMPGGDLRYHIGRQKRFSEEQTKFFVACIITALEYLHLSGIIHRDIKPENLVLDAKGYLRLTDFGIAKVLQLDNSGDSSGTPGYMAPEVMNKQHHGCTCDYFAVGVLAYEFMKGNRPYRGRDRKEILDKIISCQVQLRRSDIPEGWSLEAADFINKLIQRKSSRRLGARSILEIKNHAWLRDFPWKKLYEKSIPSPFIPPAGDNFDRRVLADWNDADQLETVNFREETMNNIFAGYYFNKHHIPVESATSPSIFRTFNTVAPRTVI